MITIGLVVVTCIISYMALNKPQLLNQLCHNPHAESRNGEYYRLLSAGFVHGSFPHLAINMFVLFQFGQIIETVFSQMFGATMSNIVFLIFYITAVIFANVGTYVMHKDNPRFTSVGASGVTSAILFIYAMLDPWQMFAFPPVPAIVFAVLYVVYSTWASTNRKDNIDHLAHLFGGVYGVIFLFVSYPDSISIFLERLLAF